MVIHNPTWLQIIFYAGILALPLGAVYSLYWTVEIYSTSGIAGGLVMACATGVLTYIAWLGVILAKFVPAKVEFDDLTFDVQVKGESTEYKWSDIASVKNSQTAQVLQLLDSTGRLIYAIDHMTPGYSAFSEKVKAVVEFS